jgi:uncharacterized protein (TIGR03084 family)
MSPREVSPQEETIARLRAEGEDLDALVADLDPPRWRTDTPATGWTIAYQVGHLQWTDEVALLALTDPERFVRTIRRAASAASQGYVDEEAGARAELRPTELLDRWRQGRGDLLAALAEAPPDVRIPWFGPPMKPRSLATARLMETWAHGQDVADALGLRREPTERLRDVADLGVRTRDFAYRVHGLEPPSTPFRVELRGPDGSIWAWGPQDATDRVTGDAVGFCLVVTQRRPLSDVDLEASGADATQWLEIAQAFAGPPTRTDENRQRAGT